MNNAQYLKEYYLKNKEAISKSKAEWYKKNKVRLLAKNKVYCMEHKEEIRQKRKKYPSYSKYTGTSVYTGYRKQYADRPDVKFKQSVRRKVRHAIQKGLLLVLSCKFCGNKAQAHHEDYDKPLEVIWLCRTHHNARHREMLLLKK